MCYEIFKFELRYRLKRLDTYVFFLFLLLFSMVGVDFVFEGIDFGPVKRNAPLVIAKTMGVITGIFMMLASMIMGTSVLRDFEYRMEAILFINPIKKRDYLLGRFLGSFVILLLIFSGVLIGMMLGERMPWHNPDDYFPFGALPYLQTFAIIALPLLFFGASLFFVGGALSRKLVVVYTQGIVLFVWFMLTKAIENEFTQSLLDPFSLTTLTDITALWTVDERNLRSIPLEGVLLYNKFLWIVLGVVSLCIGYHKFNFHGVQNGRKKKEASIFRTLRSFSEQEVQIPTVSLHQDFKAKWMQFAHLSWFHFRGITKQASFWAILICGMLIIFINSVSLGTVYEVDSHPTTYFIVEELQENSIYFFIIILVFYSAELIWKERRAKMELIHDATPISDFVQLMSKYCSLLLMYAALMVSLIVSGIVFQTMNGYYQFEVQVYFYGFFLELFPFLALYSFLAFFVQVITNQKFIGIILVIALFIGNLAFGTFGLDHDLYFFGGNALGKYSDMNGYGHFLKPYLFIKIYWALFGMILLLLAAVFSVRGTDIRFWKRMRLSKNKWSKPLFSFGISVLVLFMVVGAYNFYNTNILNTYWSNSKENAFRTSYEKELKPLEYYPQPKIVSVNLKMELYPESRDYVLDGYYTLKNTNEDPIVEVHVQKAIEDNVRLYNVDFEGGAVLQSQYADYDYNKYMLKEPLLFGDSIQMNFRQTYTTKGFEVGSSDTKIVYNGTFLTNEHFPTLGYNNNYELRDTDERVAYGLANATGKKSREDKRELLNARSGSDSDGINFEIIIGTALGQTAIAPGNLVKTWVENERNYFHYKMDRPMINFYSIVSARYEVLKDVWTPKNDSLGNPIDLEIYYHKGHEYNLDRMLESMHFSFDYYGKNFSPYPYKQMRIMEIPRYAQFAQSFPTAVPFSEALGFVLNIDEEEDVDMAFFITAHELAHQWWGLQVEAANVQGRNMILETLAQYSATMVLKEKYSKEKVQQFLAGEKKRYEAGRLRDKSQEVPLSLVENQEYIYYRKGAINMYVLQEAIGEKKVNLALRRFLKDWNTQSGTLKMETERYATTKDLLNCFKDVTPEGQQHVITDLFEKIGEIDNIAVVK
ncbi:peptidase M1 [Aggregatimonas sangjinii]|uniref:Peptidase M1 n=1 Tax=Aggregatimonas sangjinii TaxID=2583587 RepID=A0A5B7SY24_9FLAO|nr:M1 family aminopeptidase [Aggregatimonas sangjinii]QCX01771.1 peptidase M1 [Aggregatimonas sangjinii]